MKKTFLSIVLAAFGSVMATAENPSVLYMIGGATEGSWDWNKATEMQPVSGTEGEYSWTGNLEASDFKIYAEKNPTWSGSISFYHPTYNDCEVSKEGVASDAVEFTTGPDNKWKVTEAGQYTITINITTLKISAIYLGAPAKTPIDTETLYLIGDAAPCGWNINSLTPCVKKDKNVFVYTGLLKAGNDITFQASPIQGNWGAKFIVPTVERCVIPETGLKDYQFDYSVDHTNQWQLEKEGTYTLTFDLNNWTLNVESNVESGVSEIDSDKNTPVEYYNLQGVRVYDPANGLYLVRKGGKVSKVMIK